MALKVEASVGKKDRGFNNKSFRLSTPRVYVHFEV